MTFARRSRLPLLVGMGLMLSRSSHDLSTDALYVNPERLYGL